MSEIAKKVYDTLREIFPTNTILQEHYIYYKGARLFFDFFIKELGILIEVQGRQHFEYVDHFHGSVESFRAQKCRDNLKREYVQYDSKLCLVYFYDEQDIVTKELILSRIYEAQNKEEGV